jgi:hypothetical protein
MDDRDHIYLQILSFGLVRIRDASALGNVAYCSVESEHLHNIPSLIGETHEPRHEYYFEKERTYYLSRVDRSVPEIGFTLARYEELWAELAKLRKC